MARKKAATATEAAYSDGEISNNVVIDLSGTMAIEDTHPTGVGQPPLEATPAAFKKRRGRPAKLKPQDLPAMDGPGVAVVKDKKLDALCDEFVEVRDEKAALAEKLGELEAQILDRMVELEITVHKFSDQVATIKPGKNHVKIKTVKTGAAE